jgi:hypothetical protein
VAMCDLGSFRGPTYVAWYTQGRARGIDQDEVSTIVTQTARKQQFSILFLYADLVRRGRSGIMSFPLVPKAARLGRWGMFSRGNDVPVPVSTLNLCVQSGTDTWKAIPGNGVTSTSSAYYLSIARLLRFFPSLPRYPYLLFDPSYYFFFNKE